MKQSSTEYAESLIVKHGNIDNAIKDVESTIEALENVLHGMVHIELTYYTEALNHLNSKV